MPGGLSQASRLRALTALLCGSCALPALAADTAILPGLYALSTRGGEAGPGSVTRVCIAPDQARGGFARPQQGQECTAVRDVIGNGRVDIVLQCGRGDARSRVSVTGRYGATDFVLVTHVRGSGAGSPRQMHFRTSGQRVRNFCVP